MKNTLLLPLFLASMVVLIKKMSTFDHQLLLEYVFDHKTKKTEIFNHPIVKTKYMFDHGALQ